MASTFKNPAFLICGLRNRVEVTRVLVPSPAHRARSVLFRLLEFLFPLPRALCAPPVTRVLVPSPAHRAYSLSFSLSRFVIVVHFSSRNKMFASLTCGQAYYRLK